MYFNFAVLNIFEHDIYIQSFYQFSPQNWDKQLKSFLNQNHFPWQTRTRLSFTVNTMVADDTRTKWARVSAAMVLAESSWDILVSAL